MFKKFSFILLAGIFVIALAGCSDSSSSSKPKEAPEEMVTLSSNVYTAVSGAMSTVQADAMTPKKGAVKAVQTITIANECGEGWCADGSMSYDDATTYPMSMDIEVTWDNFTANDVILESGTCGYVMDMPSQTEMHYDYTGDFVVVYQGTTYDFGWEINVDYVNGSYTFDGTFTVDGEEYAWAASAK